MQDCAVFIRTILVPSLDGIIVPQVNSADVTADIVAFAKYPPLGSRSVGVGRAHRYGHDFAGYVSEANTSTSVIVQIEHRDAVDNIEKIVAVEGIDGVFVGPYDLSGSLGCIGDVGNPMVRDAVATVRAACVNAGVPVGIFGLTAETGRSLVEAGYDFVAVGIDMSILDAAARQIVEVLH